MTLRFYPGGPRAVRGYDHWVDANGNNGCDIVMFTGAKIPWQTYHNADPRVSQREKYNDSRIGHNDTALIPIEV